LHLTHTARSKLRQEHRHQRRRLRPRQQQQAALRLSKQLCATPSFLRAKVIATYIADDGEIALQNVIAKAWQQGKAIYTPAFDARKEMYFVRYQKGDQLIAKQWGVKVPAAQTTPIKLPAFDLILTPLVAFDLEGNRLGRGGGYYDRFLAQYGGAMQTIKQSRRPVIMGVAHSCQQTTPLAAQPWDIKLDAIATDKAITYFN